MPEGRAVLRGPQDARGERAAIDMGLAVGAPPADEIEIVSRFAGAAAGEIERAIATAVTHTRTAMTVAQMKKPWRWRNPPGAAVGGAAGDAAGGATPAAAGAVGAAGAVSSHA